MTTLLESLQKRLGQAGTAPTPTQGPGQQAQLTQALKAGTGKASGPAVSAKQSSLGEQSAQATVGQQQLQQQQQTQAAIQGIQQQASEIAQQGALAEERLQAQRTQAEGQLASQARVAKQDFKFQEEQAKANRDAKTYMALNQMTQRAEQALQQLATQKGVKLDDLFANYTREQIKLELDKEASELHQKLFNLALANKAYVDEITMIGERKRLNSALDFQTEMQDMIWGNEITQMQEHLEWLKAEDINAREFDITMAYMGRDTKLAIYAAMENATRTQFYGQSVKQAGQAAIDIKDALPEREPGLGPKPTLNPGDQRSPTTSTYGI